MFISNDSNLIYVEAAYANGVITATYDYVGNMQDQYVFFGFNRTIMGPDASTLAAVTFIVQVEPTNNIPAVHNDAVGCTSKIDSEKTFQFIEIAGYIILLLSVLPCKIVGLELFGVLQLAFFVLGGIDMVNVRLSPLMGMKGLNGYSFPLPASSSSGNLPKRVVAIGYTSSNFLDNCNAMLILLLA